MSPVERTRRRVLGREVSLLEAGAGDDITLLLLHGVPTGAEIWRPLLERLGEARGVRAVAPDLPGFGESEPPRNPSIGGYHRCVSALAPAAGRRPLVLVGHDLGGLYALTWAVAFPERLRALVLLNTTIYPHAGVALGLAPLLAPGFGEAYAWLAGRERYRGRVLRDLRSLYPEGTPGEVVERLVAPYGRTVAWLALVRALRGLNPVRVLRWRARMRDLDVPVLILWGEGDPYFQASVPERLGRDLPRARGEYVSGGGHFPMLSRPDEVACAGARFVRDLSGDGDGAG